MLKHGTLFVSVCDLEIYYLCYKFRSCFSFATEMFESSL